MFGQLKDPSRCLDRAWMWAGHLRSWKSTVGGFLWKIRLKFEITFVHTIYHTGVWPARVGHTILHTAVSPCFPLTFALRICPENSHTVLWLLLPLKTTYIDKFPIKYHNYSNYIFFSAYLDNFTEENAFFFYKR